MPRTPKTRTAPPPLVRNPDGTYTCPTHDLVVYPDELGCGECAR